MYKYTKMHLCNVNPLVCSSFSAVEGEGQGRILQRFPEKDWEDSPFPQGIELVSPMLLRKLKAMAEHTTHGEKKPPKIPFFRETRALHLS